MNYHAIQKVSLNNGEGCRTVLWVSGCNHHCKGCHNPQTWDEKSGQLFGTAAFNQLLDIVSLPYIDGLTLSGGDPMYPANRPILTAIANKVKQKTKKSIWMYTGYKFEEIKDEPILEYIDVVVDGEYIEALRDEDYIWAGSTNQKIWRKKNDIWLSN